MVVFVQAGGLFQGLVGALGEVLEQRLGGAVQPGRDFGLVPEYVGQQAPAQLNFAKGIAGDAGVVGQPRLQLPQNHEQVVGRLVEAAHRVVDLGAQAGAPIFERCRAFQQPESQLFGQHRVLGHEAGQKLVFLLFG